jgi:hypothetical protein
VQEGRRRTTKEGGLRGERTKAPLKYRKWIYINRSCLTQYRYFLVETLLLQEWNDPPNVPTPLTLNPTEYTCLPCTNNETSRCPCDKHFIINWNCFSIKKWQQSKRFTLCTVWYCGRPRTVRSFQTRCRQNSNTTSDAVQNATLWWEEITSTLEHISNMWKYILHIVYKKSGSMPPVLIHCIKCLEPFETMHRA